MTCSTCTDAITLVTGVLLEKHPDRITLSLPGTEYQLHLTIDAAAAETLGEVGTKISGRIYANPKRLDPSNQGGRFMEPLYGRPRRIQGRIIKNNKTDKVVLQCAPGCTMILSLPSAQKADAFAIGDLVGCDLQQGARFEPATKHGH